MIEAQVHQQLRAFLREQGEPYWPHHLTMARLVARALRLGRSALIQAGSSSACHGRYRLSYLMPILLWPEPAILVLPEAIQQRVLMVEIPRLRQWIPTAKPLHVGDRWPTPDFNGLLLTTPSAWLSDRMREQTHFPSGVLTLIDGVDELEMWAHQQLTNSITAADWDALMWAFPDHQNLIRDTRVQLTHLIFQHPSNPYECHLVDTPEQQVLTTLHDELNQELPGLFQSAVAMPPAWKNFWQRFYQPETLVWATTQRQQGQIALHCSPAEVASILSPVWTRQPLVLIGAALDLDTQAHVYRQRLGLEDMTCLKFSLDRQNELIQLYSPDRLPMPNTSEFQPAILVELRRLIIASAQSRGLMVILVSDTPLKGQIGSQLAGEFGSRVQVEKTCLDENGILVAGWDFWRQHQNVLPAPHLLVITTLPLPSLENPLVAGRVSYYKRHRQDWFRLYLLPEALSELQRAIAPVRDSQGLVALLDNRVNYRSYGRQILSALSPFARISYIDPAWFGDSSIQSMGL